MRNNFQACLAFVLHEEGGYSDNPKDPGGITNLGVTLRTWQAWVGHSVTAHDMAALTPAAVTPLYLARYWDAVKGDALPAGLDLCLFDSSVNQGPGTAAQILQGVLSLPKDGIIGPHALAALAGGAPIDAFCTARETAYRADKDFPTFGKGWLARVAACQKLASGMAAAPSAVA